MRDCACAGPGFQFCFPVTAYRLPLTNIQDHEFGLVENFFCVLVLLGLTPTRKHADHADRRTGHQRPGPPRVHGHHRCRAGGRGRDGGLDRPAHQAPAADTAVDAGRAVLPGFVDSHAHLVFAGERSAEFAARMAGRPYQAGGILTTVGPPGPHPMPPCAPTCDGWPPRCAQGTTTFECKSGTAPRFDLTFGAG